MSLAQEILLGSRLALARLLTQIENNTPQGREVLAQLFPHTGRAQLIGVTGAPGTGKSSLVNALAQVYRHPGDSSLARRVGIVAVDPSSPFTGGAILGDRVRMRDLAGDPGVFIRSMASRGSLGGLATATSGVVQALDAAGFDIILIETVGVGQAEVDIARLAHTTLVIEAPGLGDDIQAIKAGILEIADILVINKADRPGVENTERALKSMLALAHPVPHIFYEQSGVFSQMSPPKHGQGEESARNTWIPLLCKTVATEGLGIGELGQAIQKHYEHLRQTGELFQRDQTRLKTELDILLREALVARWRTAIGHGKYEEILQKMMDRKISPWQVVDELIQ